MFRLTNGQRLTACPDAVPESVDLDSVFNRLQVNTDSLCLQTNPKNTSPTTTTTTATSTTAKPVENNAEENFQIAVGKKLKEKRRKEKGRKGVIRKAHLVLPSTDKQSATETDDNNHYCDVGPSTSTSSSSHLASSNSSASSSPDTPVSCGAQHAQQTHRQTQGDPAATSDDANADELASYFEQMLVIPKPMSLMAEMMYA